MSHPSPVAPLLPAFFSNFAVAFAALFSEAACASLAAACGPRGGGTPKLSLWQWIMARVYHGLARSGTFAANVKTITRITLSDSALSCPPSAATSSPRQPWQSGSGAFWQISRLPP